MTNPWKLGKFNPLLKTKNQNNKEPNFEESLARLEGLVHEMESGDLPLEDILKKYEEGNRLIKICAAKLNEAEKRIELLTREKDGSIGLRPFDLDQKETEDTKEEGKAGKSEESKTTEEEDLF